MKAASVKLAILIALAVTLIFDVYIVDADSMRPELLHGDLLLCSTLFSLSRQDVAVVKVTEPEEVIVVKRVVGVPGDVISYRGEVAFVNGRELQGRHRTSFFADPAYAELNSMGALPPLKSVPIAFENVRLNDHEYFLLGDNRSSSTDSRSFGPVDAKDVLCEAKMIVGTLRTHVNFLSRVRLTFSPDEYQR